MVLNLKIEGCEIFFMRNEVHFELSYKFPAEYVWYKTKLNEVFYLFISFTSICIHMQRCHILNIKSIAYLAKTSVVYSRRWPVLHHCAYNTHTHIDLTVQQLNFIRTFHVGPVIAFLKDLPMVYTANPGAIHMPRSGQNEQ